MRERARVCFDVLAALFGCWEWSMSLQVVAIRQKLAALKRHWLCLDLFLILLLDRF